MKKKLIPIFILFILALISCNSNYTVGKKKGYFKIDLPEKKYQPFNMPGYPYTFEYPVYAVVSKDTSFFDEKAGDWWINIDVPKLSGRIYISYKTIHDRNNFDSLVNDAMKMVYKQHTEVSTGITDSMMKTANAEGI